MAAFSTICVVISQAKHTMKELRQLPYTVQVSILKNDFMGLQFIEFAGERVARTFATYLRVQIP